MFSRPQAAALQLAAFVLGGIVGPVCHLARHRADHTHGPDGAAVGLAVGQGGDQGPEPDGHPHPHPHDDPPTEHVHDHGFGHHHAAELLDHSHPHENHDQPAGLDHDLAFDHDFGHEAEHDVDRATADRDRGVGPTLPLDHGHGSISHFGLALIGTAPPLPLPRPERRELLEVSARTAHARLFHPSFPLPRPPPAGLAKAEPTDA